MIEALLGAALIVNSGCLVLLTRHAILGKSAHRNGRTNQRPIPYGL